MAETTEVAIVQTSGKMSTWEKLKFAEQVQKMTFGTDKRGNAVPIVDGAKKIIKLCDPDEEKKKKKKKKKKNKGLNDYGMDISLYSLSGRKKKKHKKKKKNKIKYYEI
jgi:hypothetical protein